MTAATVTMSRAVCPAWCTRHTTDPDGSVCHESGLTIVTAAGGGNLVDGAVELRLNRFDERGDLGPVAVCLAASPDGIDLTAAELRRLAAAALNLADLIEATR